MTSTNVLLLVSVTLFFNRDVGYSQPTTKGNGNGSTVQNNAGNCAGASCVVQQICHGRPSPQAFSELVSLVKEMNKKLDVMEAKLDAVCSGECPSKRGIKHKQMENDDISTLYRGWQNRTERRDFKVCQIKHLALIYTFLPLVPRNCAEVFKSGNTTSGVYTIRPDNGDAFEVYCDQTTSGGGWTVFQKRLNGAVDFYRGWDDYKKGFGLVDGEFWLGLDKLRRLTNQTVNELRVDLKDFNQAKGYAGYDLFKVENESKHYELKLGVYSGKYKLLKMTYCLKEINSS